MVRFVKILKIFMYTFLIYLAVFVFCAGIVFAENTVSDWKEKDSVIIKPEGVEISGTNRLSRELVLLVTGLNERVSWFDIDERSLEKYLYSTGWVKKSTVKKTFPDSIRIVVEEFVPSIIVSSVNKKGGETSDSMYAMWFADKNGIIFKMAFPGEIDDQIPFFHIDSDVSLDGGQRDAVVKNAVLIAEDWKDAGNICEIRSMRYDSIGNYIADCEGHNGLVTVIHMGKFENRDDIGEMSRRFMDTAGKLQQKNIWAGEYIFEGSGTNRRIVVGKVVKKIKRGSDA